MGWDGKDLLESTSYGKLYLITKRTKERVFLKRVRRNSNNLMLTNESRCIKIKGILDTPPDDLDMLFIDHEKTVSLLKPQGPFKESIIKLLR